MNPPQARARPGAQREGHPVGAPTVIVLASGRGERFAAAGGSTHKLQARLGDQTVLAHTLETQPEALDDVALHIAPQAELDATLVLRALRQVREQLQAAQANGRDR